MVTVIDIISHFYMLVISPVPPVELRILRPGGRGGGVGGGSGPPGPGLPPAPPVHPLQSLQGALTLLLVIETRVQILVIVRAHRLGVRPVALVTAGEIHLEDGGPGHGGVREQPLSPLDVAVEQSQVTDQEAAPDTGNNQENLASPGLRGSIRGCVRRAIIRGLFFHFCSFCYFLHNVCRVVTLSLLIKCQDVETVSC